MISDIMMGNSQEFSKQEMVYDFMAGECFAGKNVNVTSGP